MLRNLIKNIKSTPMKPQLILLVIVGILLIPLTLNGVTKNSTLFSIENTTESSSTIRLEGKLEKSGGFRSGTDPIVAEQHNSVLYILFQKDVGVLQVTLDGPLGIVYTTWVDTSTPSTITIPLESLSSGIYILTFNNEHGMMQGELEV